MNAPSRPYGRLRATSVRAAALLALAARIDLAHAQAPRSGPAPEGGVGATTAVGATPPLDPASHPLGAARIDPSLLHDLSPWGMFLHADTIVKAVMLGLGLASLVTWTLWLVKGSILARRTRRTRAAVRALGAADTLGGDPEPAWQRSGAVGAMVDAALTEVRRSQGLPKDGIKERVGLVLGRIEARAARSVTGGTGIIATIGSTAPFVGLFGTVWGIMDSFVGISQAHTSNLAVVAPGIAEALLATAIGLVAAIPAVVIYNGFARATAGYRALLADGSAEVLRHLSRDLDRRGDETAPVHRAAE